VELIHLTQDKEIFVCVCGVLWAYIWEISYLAEETPVPQEELKLEITAAETF